MLCHGDMNDILRVGELLREKPLVILHLRRLGASLPAPGNVHQQLIRLNFLPIQEAALIRMDVVGTNGNAEFFDKGFRKVAHAVRGNKDGAALGLLKDQDVLFHLRLPGLLVQMNQPLGKNA